MSTYFITLLIVWILTETAQKSVNLFQAEDGRYSIKRTTQCNFLLLLTGFVLISVAGLRYHVGTDYGSYERLFSVYSNTAIHSLLSFDEPILPIIGKLCGMMGGTAQWMFYVVSFITIGIVLFSSYHESCDFAYVTLLYVFTGCWHGSFNGIRQYLAISVIFIGRRYIRERRLLKYILVCFIAFLCHKSALVFLPLYLIYAQEIKWERVLLVFTGTIILARSSDILFSMVGWFNSSDFIMNEYASSSVSFFRIAVRVAPAVLALFYALNKKLNQDQVLYFYLLIIHAAVGIVTGGSAYLARLGSFTGVFVPLGLNSIIKSTSRQNYHVIRLVILVLFFVYWTYDITNSTTLREYEWCFDYM